MHPQRYFPARSALIATTCLNGPAAAAPDYHPIDATMADRTATLTGHDLTVDQVVQVARYGAKVQLSPEAAARGGYLRGGRMKVPPKACRSTRSTGGGPDREYHHLRGRSTLGGEQTEVGGAVACGLPGWRDVRLRPGDQR